MMNEAFEKEVTKLDWEEIEGTINEIVERQKKGLLTLGRRIIPTLTPEDLLQPNDYPELDHHPEFRYEEGLLAGMQTVQTALYAIKHSQHYNP